MPGRNHIDIKASSTMRGETEEEINVKDPAAREMIPRKILIRRSDVTRRRME